MKELSVQEQTTVTGGMSWEIAAMVLALGAPFSPQEGPRRP